MFLPGHGSEALLSVWQWRGLDLSRDVGRVQDSDWRRIDNNRGRERSTEQP
jgi:hypothetical protein